MTTLLLRLEGPMQSYGTQAAMDEIRDTAAEPTKAAVIGMACGAMGKDRETDGADSMPRLAELAALRMGVRVDKEGLLLNDFQVACSKERIPTASGAPGRGAMYAKYYLVGASFLIGLEGDIALIGRISDALLRPRWAPCLGRRCCIPTRPLLLPDGGIRQKQLVAALLDECPVLTKTRFVVDAKIGEGTRRVTDVPLSFASQHRKFGAREIREWFETPKGATRVP